jgi:hypothetical protein
MKKLALVGILFSGVLMSAAIAQAGPMGMSNAEYHALMVRSEGLNQKHGVGQNSQRPLVSEKLAGLDLSAAASSGPLDPWQQNLNARVKFKNTQVTDPWALNLFARHAYNASKVASQSQPASTGGLDWGAAEIGAAFAFGAVLVGVASLVTIRRHHRPIAH